MPTIKQLPLATQVSATDEVPVSQGGVTRSAKVGLLLAGTQPAITLVPGALLGRVSPSAGGPEPVGIGVGLKISGGNLAATGADHLALPVATDLFAGDEVVVNSAASARRLPASALRALFSAGTGVQIDAAGVISALGGGGVGGVGATGQKGDAGPAGPVVAATAATIGAVKPGAGLSVGADGTLTIGDGSGIAVTASRSVTARTAGARAADVVNARDFGAALNGVTDDTAALAAALAAAGAGPVTLPAGVAPVTVATEALVGRLQGTGQVRTMDGHKRGPSFSRRTTAPTGYGGDISSAFDGDISTVHLAIEHRIEGENTLTKPATAYAHHHENSAISLQFLNSSGWNESTTGEGPGRTGVSAIHGGVSQVGQGDAYFLSVGGFATGTKPGSTHFLANPAILAFGGGFFSFADGTYQEVDEFTHDDSAFGGTGYDIAVSSTVRNFNRSNDTGAKGAWWLAFRLQSLGAKPVDVAMQPVGKWSNVLDTTATNSGANKSVWTQRAGQRTYLDGVAETSGFNNPRQVTFGTTYTHYNPATAAFEVVVGGVTALSVAAGAVRGLAPAPGSSDTTLATTAFVATAVAAGVGATGPAGAQGPAGASGPAGPKGDTGLLGPVGAIGPAGPKGDTGLTGSAGLVGPVGTTGAVGPAGVAGAAGLTGSAGLKGDTGLVGPVGATGAVGPVGVAGAAGLTGSAGLKGDTGLVGPVGATGAVGPVGVAGAAGLTGSAGLKGDTGLVGPVGATGAVGPVGVAGAAGLTGSAGLKGDTGLVGPVGATGAVGPVGVAGAAGLTGSAGLKGDAGLTGAVGLAGDAGAAGLTGSAGPKGDIGLSGTMGPTGATGAIGPKGDTGLTGTTGPAGPTQAATAVAIGAVKPGTGLAVAGDGTLSTTPGSAYLNTVLQSGTAGALPRLDVFTASGGFSWTKLLGAAMVDVVLIGPGGGGGAGAVVSSGTAASGGAGGGAGARVALTVPAALLPATVSGTVGPASAGGSGSGSAGAGAGGASSAGASAFGGLSASGGLGGMGGQAGASANGGAGGGANGTGSGASMGAASNSAPTALGGGPGGSYAANGFGGSIGRNGDLGGPASGASGGGVTIAPGWNSGAPGGIVPGVSPALGGLTAGASGAVAGTPPFGYSVGASGGSGAAGVITNGGSAGAGSGYGAGGSGGGGCIAGFTAGSGAAGMPGLVIVVQR